MATPCSARRGSEFIWRVRAALPDAQDIVDEGPDDSPGVMYAQALVHHAAGRTVEAREWLARAVALEPRLEVEARADGLT